MGVLCPGPLGWALKPRVPGRGPRQLLSLLCGDYLQASPAKKPRAGPQEPGSPPSSPLSPEQLIRIQRSKAAALLRLGARNVPVGFDESWKKHLSGEFGKPYFIKVNLEAAGILRIERAKPTVVRDCFRGSSFPSFNVLFMLRG